MALFQFTHIVAEKRTKVLLNADFSLNNWETLEKFYREEIKEGQIFWDLDMGRLHFISSMMLGMIVGFNTLLMSRGGKLRVLTPQNSKIADLIQLSKLDTIIELVRYDSSVKESGATVHS